MATSWSEIITDSAMTIIDDVRWQEGLFVNAAQYFRAKSLYIKMALPMMNKPPELLSYLQKEMKEPSYDYVEWTSTEESTEVSTQLDTGKFGFELCSVSFYSESGEEAFPYTGASYDSDTGIVTIPVQEKPGVTYSIDFYSDGEFADLTPTQKRLFGLAISCVWDERFDRNWLNIQMKIKDSSFNTVNESNYMKESGARKMANRNAFESELKKYEQDTTYRRVVGDRSSVIKNMI